MGSENYTPGSFQEKLNTQSATKLKGGDTIVSEGIDYATREQRYGWGKAAESNVEGLFAQKTAEAKQAFLMMRDSQLAEFKSLNDKELLIYHDAVMGSISERFNLMLNVTTLPSPVTNQGDKVISTNPELVNLRERGITLLQSIDVQRVICDIFVAQNRPKLKDSYLQMIGKNLEDTQPNYFGIIKKVDEGKDLAPEDYDLLINAAQALKGQSLNAMQHGPLIAVLGTLKPINRFELLQRMSQTPKMSNFNEWVITMATSGYVTPVQALTVVDAKIALLSADKKEEKKNAAEILALQQARAVIASPKMAATQSAVAERRRQGAEYMGTHTFGHVDRFGKLATVKGVGSILLGVNGAIGLALNISASLFTDPLSLVTNPALWLSAAELGAGMQMSGGFGGYMGKPTEWVAAILKNRNEAADAKMEVNVRAFKDELGIHPQEACFYVNYAKRIEIAYNEKKKNDPVSDPKITLKDLGINAKGDLPAELQALYDQKPALEALVSGWATRFHRTTGNGVGATSITAETQVKLMDDARIAATKEAYARYKIPATSVMPAAAGPVIPPTK